MNAIELAQVLVRGTLEAKKLLKDAAAFYDLSESVVIKIAYGAPFALSSLIKVLDAHGYELTAELKEEHDET